MVYVDGTNGRNNISELFSANRQNNQFELVWNCWLKSLSPSQNVEVLAKAIIP